MPIRGAIPFTFRAAGACDAIDGSNAAPGAMSSLKNLIPNPLNLAQKVPRTAATQLSNFSGFTTPAQVECALVVGSRVYGMIASARFAGKSEPFCYDMVAAAFVTIGGAVAANCPTSQAISGDWTPPIMAMVGTRILITHPGYPGGTVKYGWIDMRAFHNASLTATTAVGSPTLTVVSANPMTTGVAVGDTVAGAGIPAGARVVSMTAATITLDQNCTIAAAGVALTIDSGTKAAPKYGAGDTNGVNLVAVPKAVAQFNGRAYYAVNNGTQYTDALTPWQITNATQALTLGDDQDVTAIAGLPLSSSLVGGIVQSLIFFKGDAPYWQLTGDQATTDLKLDQVQGSAGTRSPLAITPTPMGLAYIAADGLRVINPMTAQASDPIGANGTGVAAPFIYAVAPSRTAAAFNRNTLRISVQNGIAPGQPNQEWWYNFKLQEWSGPHDFPAALIQPCGNGQGDFVLAAVGVNGKLFVSTISPSPTSTYTENGAAMSFQWRTTLLPDNQQGAANAIVETTLGLQMPGVQALTVQATDEQGNNLGTVALAGVGAGGGVWGSMVWGVGTWGGSVTPFAQWAIEWPAPLVFKQAQVSVSGPSTYGLVIGNLNAPYQVLGYQGAPL